MLRTTFVIILIGIGLRYSFKGAFHVLLFYLWIAYFRPDAWIWTDWVTQLNLSFIVGFYVVLATVFTKERFRFGIGQVLMLLFLVHSGLSIVVSPANIEGINLWPVWYDFVRKIVIGFSLVVLVTSEEKLRLTLLVIALSLSFEGAKQGWAQLVTNPGATNTNESPFLGDNNGVAVGVLMLIPILTALAQTTSSKWQKFMHRFLVVGMLYRSISTYSRGGFLAAVALGGHYLLRAKYKMRTLIGVVMLVAIIYPVMPNAFWERMGTIQTAAEAEDESELDTSQAGRLHFWRVGADMGNDRPFWGVGFDAYNHMYDAYDFREGAFGKKRSVHSAWFGMLAEVGYVGLGMFLILIGRAFYINWRARKMAKARPDLANLVAYGTALEASLVAFAVGGTFVPFQYNEMLWHFIALTIVLDRLIKERLALPAPVPIAQAKATVVGNGPRSMLRPLSPTARLQR